MTFPLYIQSIANLIVLVKKNVNDRALNNSLNLGTDLSIVDSVNDSSLHIIEKYNGQIILRKKLFTDSVSVNNFFLLYL